MANRDSRHVLPSSVQLAPYRIPEFQLFSPPIITLNPAPVSSKNHVTFSFAITRPVRHTRDLMPVRIKVMCERDPSSRHNVSQPLETRVWSYPVGIFVWIIKDEWDLFPRVSS